jgi:hypothetical protein
MTVRTVAMLTAGGLAPCLSSAVGGLIERYSEIAPDVRIIAYTNGYAGLLKGESIGAIALLRNQVRPFTPAEIAFAGKKKLSDVAAAIDTVEASIRAAVPIARVIYLEPDVYIAPNTAHPTTDAIVIKSAD